MGDSGKLRFYELDHESNMRLLKTHSHTSNGLAMEPETREPGDLVGVADAPLLRIPLSALQHPTQAAGPHPGQTTRYRMRATPFVRL